MPTQLENETMYLIDKYVSVSPGDPYRLFPFGVIVKNGKRREITPEFAATFRLPHFKPPIKRGSHADEAPAGGHIKALEVRADGLYAIPEYNENGKNDIQAGAYRYHSPEVIWSDGPVFEDPSTGEMIHGPLIVGDALLHTPHLGEAAALYSVEPYQTHTEGNMTEQTMEVVEVPKKWYEGILQRFSANSEPEPEPQTEQPAVEVEAFEALKTERDNLQAEIDRLKAEGERDARVEKYNAAIAETKAHEDFGALLAKLDDETADRIVQEFKALSAQIDESALLGERGTSGAGLTDDNRTNLHNAILAKAEEKGIDYNSARQLLAKEQPGLFE